MTPCESWPTRLAPTMWRITSSASAGGVPAASNRAWPISVRRSAAIFGMILPLRWRAFAGSLRTRIVARAARLRPRAVRRRFYLVGDEAALDGGGLDRLLQFLEGADLDLAHPLARDAILLREVLERGRVVAQSALGQDMALAVVEVRHRLFEEVAAQPQLLAISEARFLALAFVDQPILPFAFAVAPERRVQGMVGAGEPAVHADHVGFGHVEFGSDLVEMFGRKIALLHRLQLALQLAQVEEQFLL